ncbi:MAG: hypothetical protein AAF788_06565 [Pseudomonadota bacterium]
MSAVLAATALFSSAHAASIVATFDTDTEGFGVDGGTLVQSPAGGNPGGFLEVTDTVGGFMELLFPQGFLDEVADNARLNFDALTIAGNGGNLVEFGVVSLTGNGQTLNADAFLLTPPPNVWTGGVLTFSAATFNATQAVFEAVLDDLTSLTMTVERNTGINEIIGIDNIEINPIPVPPAAALMAGVLAVGAWRRRKTS